MNVSIGEEQDNKELASLPPMSSIPAAKRSRKSAPSPPGDTVGVFSLESFSRRLEQLRQAVMYPSRVHINNIQRLFELCSMRPHRFELVFELKSLEASNEQQEGFIVLDGVKVLPGVRGRGKKQLKARCFDQLVDRLCDPLSLFSVRDSGGEQMLLEWSSSSNCPAVAERPVPSGPQQQMQDNLRPLMEGALLHRVPQDCIFIMGMPTYRLRYLLAAGIDMLGDNVMKAGGTLSPEPMILYNILNIRDRILSLLNSAASSANSSSISAVSLLINAVNFKGKGTMIPTWLVERCLDPPGFCGIFLLDYAIVSEFMIGRNQQECKELASKSAIQRILSNPVSIEKVAMPPLSEVVVHSHHKYIDYPPVYCLVIDPSRPPDTTPRSRNSEQLISTESLVAAAAAAPATTSTVPQMVPLQLMAAGQQHPIPMLRPPLAVPIARRFQRPPPFAQPTGFPEPNSQQQQ